MQRVTAAALDLVRGRPARAAAWSTSSAMMAAVGCSAVTMPTDWPAITRAVLDVAVDHRAAQRAGPEMLDGELRRFLVQFAGLEAVAASPPGGAGTAWCPR